MSKSVIGSIILFKVCGVMARKRTVVSARDVLSRDDRPPIVYLRSFRDDGQTSGQSGSAFWGVLGRLMSPPFEDVLARTLQRYGPFVAIGRPGEEVSDIGAARMYVGDDDWQAVIADLLSRPGSLVLFQAGATAGLRWELETAASVLTPDQLLIFLPMSLAGSPRKRRDQYADFRAWASDCLPQTTLPEQLSDKTRFLYFAEEPAWEVLDLRRNEPVPRRHPLGAVLVELQHDWKTLRRVQNSPWLIAILLLFVLLPLLVFVMLILMSYLAKHY